MVQDSAVPRPDRQEIAAVALGGAAGALLRVALARSNAGGPGDWPWVTFAVNLAGAFLLGYFATRLQERLPLSAYRRPLLGTGFCGALTTYSTLSYETLRLYEAGARLYSLANVTVSLAAGLGAASLGYVVGSLV
jgi:fluoride exporter